MSMETVKELCSIKQDPGQNYLKDLNRFHELLKDLPEEDRHVIVVAMVELGYRAKSPKAIANIVGFLKESFSMGDSQRETMYQELTNSLFGGKNNAKGQ